MKLLNTSIRKNGGAASPRHLGKLGFTLIEILVVMGLLGLFATMGLAYSFDSYRGYLFRAEYTTTVNLMARARNRAINNFNENHHGVHIDNNEYVLFSGSIYDPSDVNNESFPRNAAVSVTNGDIIFEQLTGNSLTCSGSPCEQAISIAYDAKIKSVTVNEIGGIDW